MAANTRFQPPWPDLKILRISKGLARKWLAFLDTVRTERFEHVLALKDDLRTYVAA